MSNLLTKHRTVIQAVIALIVMLLFSFGLQQIKENKQPAVILEEPPVTQPIPDVNRND